MNKCQSFENVTNEEKRLIQLIWKETKKLNIDNISRTNAYLEYYIQNKEICWAFLAHMVSRNAGWCMCDLEGQWFPSLLQKDDRDDIFTIYEKANWIIFQDAFPQLLLYQYCVKVKRPMFHLLKYFHVSSFMEQEWNIFWEWGEKRRLMVSLIINEQNVIQEPIIRNSQFRKREFHSIHFLFQDWLHFSSVILPTCKGTLYGASVSGFLNVNRRIELGKKLSIILFEPNLYSLFYDFAQRTVHTGSRSDYECYLMKKPARQTPMLRMIYPIVEHGIHEYDDWFNRSKIKRSWYKEPKQKYPWVLTEWFEQKQKQLKKMALLKMVITD